MAITDWIGNFFWDSFNRIFIYVIDNVLYSLMGFLYKVFLIIGTFDLFGGYTSGTDETMEIYQAFTKRIYSVIGIVVMFILAYQIILFVIDPDKGLKESKKLVTNIVKGIILTILAPLIFHYLSIIQYHVLVSDNLIWNIVLGEGASSSSNVIESGNTMASMLFISVFHPVGTQYSDFYNSDGTLTSPSTACSKYNDAMSSISDDGYMSQDTLARTFKNAGLGLIIFGPVGAAVGAVYTWITDEANKTSTCDYYYWILYQGGLEKSSWQEVKPNEVSSITNYAESTAGYSNKASVLAPNNPLIDEIYQENHMEYYYFSPIGAIAVIFFLIAYTLDIAARAFKLAFLQLIAPVPILLGTIPKNEKIYTTWKDRFVKTYIDIFVRVFVMAFIALMIKLLPAFVDTLMSVFKSTVGGEDAATGMLKAVTFFALVVGLLRAAKDIPELFMDLIKNGGGLLSGININPLESYKKSSKPIGAMAGAAAGLTAGAFNGAKGVKGKGLKATGKRILQGASGAVRGTIAGGRAGYNNGFGRGALTKTAGEASAAVRNQFAKRDAIYSAIKDGDRKELFNIITGDRFSHFKSAITGDMEHNKEYFDAAAQFDSVAKSGKLIYSKGMDAFKNALNDEAQYAIDNRKETGTGYLTFGDQTYKGTIGEIVSNLKKNVEDEMNDVTNKVIGAATVNADGTRSFTYNGKTYTSKSGSDADIAAVKNEISNDVKKHLDYNKKIQNIDDAAAKDFKKIFTTDFGDRTFTGTYSEIKEQIGKEKKAMITAKEKSNASTTVASINGDEIVTQFAQQARDVYSGRAKVLSDDQRRAMNTSIRESLADADVLKRTLGISDASTENVLSVMDKLQSTSFKNNRDSLSEADRKAFNDQLGSLLHAATDSYNKVAESSNILKSVSEGAKTSRFGTTDYALNTSSSSKSDKK